MGSRSLTWQQTRWVLGCLLSGFVNPAMWFWFAFSRHVNCKQQNEAFKPTWDQKPGADRMIGKLRSMWRKLVAPSVVPARRGTSAQLQQGMSEHQQAQPGQEHLPVAERAPAQRQAALFRLSAELAATLEESEVGQCVVDGLHDTLDYDFVALFLVDETTGDRVLAAQVGFHEPPRRISPGQGLSERPLLDGKVHYTPDVTQDPRYFYGMGGSEVDVPVRIGGKVLGVLVAESRQFDAFSPDDLEVLTAAAHQVGLAIGKARLLAAERQRADELDALRTTMADITAELELSTLLQAIVERAAELLDATGGELGLYDEASQEIRIVVSHNLGKGHVGTCHELGEGAMGTVAETCEPLIIEDYLAWEPRAPQYADVQMHASLAAPLVVGGRLVGAITIATTDPARQFGPADLHLLTLFAQQAAIAIENARLFAETEQRVAELATLTDVGRALSSTLRVDDVLQLVYEQTRRVMYAEDMIIGLYDEARHDFECALTTNPEDVAPGARVPADSGGSGWVINHRKSLLIANDVVQRQRELGIPSVGIPSASWLCVPMLRGERVLGVIVVQHYTTPNVFDESHQALLETIASQAAIAIENARLFETEQHRAEQFRVIGEVGRRIASILDVDELLEQITGLVKEAFNYYAVGIGLVEGDEVVFRFGAGAFWDDPELESVRVKVGREGITGWVAQSGEPLLAPDVSREPRYKFLSQISETQSELTVPLKVKDAVIGVLDVESDRLNAFDESDLMVLQSLAHQAAVAIENARLFEQAQQEIAERKRAEAELRQYQEHLEELVEERTADLRGSEERYRTLFDGVPVGLYRTTSDGQHVDVNPAHLQILGYPSREDLLAINSASIYVDPEDRVRWKELMEREGVVRDFEVRVRRPDGTIIWVNDTARAVKDEQGQVLYYEGSVEDITERKQAETELRKYQEHLEELVEERTAELRESEERYRTLFDGVPVGLYRTTPEGQILDANLAFVQAAGYSNRETLLEVNTGTFYVDPEEQRQWKALMEREGVVRDFEARIRQSDGTVRWISDSARVVKDRQGKVLYYEGSTEDITERKRAEQELQQAKEAAEGANQAKSTFLANMSHELRTPLNAIIGFTRLVKRRSGDVLPQKQLDNLDKVLISASHLLEQINGVLDLSKIEAGRIDVQPTTFELEPLVDACLQTMQPLVKSERLLLVKEIAPRLPPLFTDLDKLRQILINLLGNAIKFAEEGAITVSAQRRGETVVLAVADTGIGIPEEALGRIFEAFQQVDTSTTRQYGGTGLGLSISLHLARLLGGDIAVESTVGVGSIFIITLPIRYTAAPPATAAVPLPEAPPETITIQTEGGPVVLAIDDDPNVIYLLQENLAEAGYRVVGAASGEEGLQKARELKPFAITLDILMPPTDGWQVLHDLKGDKLTRDIPVVVLSIVDKKELGYRLGAFDYLLKPFDREAILSALSRIARAPASPHRVHLLVVDDDPQVVDLVHQLLEEDTYEVRSAADGQEALEAIFQECPDIIMLDLLMPRLDGFGVIEQLRQSTQYCDVPIIVLTAKELTADELAQLQQNVSEVIQKQGLEQETLLQELRTALQAYHPKAEPGV